MFDYICGSLVSVNQKNCVIDTGSVGWSLHISAKTAAYFSGKETVRAYTHLNVGNGDRSVMELYGFYDREERDLFRLLIDVSGIGPKAAISILSALSVREFTMCVLAGDAKALTAAQGIGMKEAQKIILELKDKISKASIGSEGVLGASSSVPTQQPSDFSEAVNALIVLGYQPEIAASAVRAVANSAKDLQDLIRLALRSMGE